MFLAFSRLLGLNVLSTVVKKANYTVIIKSFKVRCAREIESLLPELWLEI